MYRALYEFFRDQGSIIAGLLALLAGYLAYRAGRAQVVETKRAARRRQWAYTAMAALEATRIKAEAERQKQYVSDTNPEKENVESRYILWRIEMQVLRSEWEQPGLLGPDAASAVHYLINAVDEFNVVIAPRNSIFRGTVLSLLAEIVSKAECAANVLRDCHARIDPSQTSHK
jgi:hypothetical protein